MDERQLLITCLTIAAVMGFFLAVGAYLILLERRVAALVQNRLGPNRVGPKGLFQPIADGLKFLFKEDVIPRNADKVLFLAAPAIAVTTALLAFAVVPFGPTATLPPPLPQDASEEMRAGFDQAMNEYNATYQFVIAPRVDIGLVFIFAVTSLTVYAIILGGWASNNKYSFLGALRSSAQLISYEIPMGMSVLGVVLLTGSLNLERIIEQQVWGGWNIWYQPLAFLLFITSAFAECNRLPFDLPEAEQELIGGYHTEYSAIKFAMFFLGEYTHMVTTSFMMATLFLGGWSFPWIGTSTSWPIVKLLFFVGKVAVFILLYMFVRWTIPRFRYDQLMSLAWKVLIPLGMANLVCVMVVREFDWPTWLLFPISMGLLAGAGLLMSCAPKRGAESPTLGQEAVLCR